MKADAVTRPGTDIEELFSAVKLVNDLADHFSALGWELDFDRADYISVSATKRQFGNGPVSPLRAVA